MLDSPSRVVFRALDMFLALISTRNEINMVITVVALSEPM